MKEAMKKGKVQTNKRKYMGDEAFAELKASMEDALDFERERPRELLITRIPRTSLSKDVSTETSPSIKQRS